MREDEGEGEEESMTHPLLFSLCFPDLVERDKRRDLFGNGLEDVCAGQRGRVMLLPRRFQRGGTIEEKKDFLARYCHGGMNVSCLGSQVSTITEDFRQQSLCLGVAPSFFSFWSSLSFSHSVCLSLSFVFFCVAGPSGLSL